MKASVKVGPRAVVEAEGESVKQVFERVADLAACFGADAHRTEWQTGRAPLTRSEAPGLR
jgi:hypothetical protein